MFDSPLISKGALFLNPESPYVLNKQALARRAYPSRMSGAIDLIPLQLQQLATRGGCHSASASTHRGAAAPSHRSQRAAVSVHLTSSHSVFLIRQASEPGSLSEIAPSASLSVSLSLSLLGQSVSLTNQ